MSERNNEIEKQEPKSPLQRMSLGAKDFYAPGTSLTFAGAAALVATLWTILETMPVKEFSEWYTGLALSALIVLAIAWGLPEPPGYPNAGKLRLTGPELIWGLVNCLMIYGLVLGLRSL